ncbi:PilZ domain-containing protein [Aureimonas sp. SK2]|uniref:PilZ domain-containing protein n=1 Tax=Aureimonas sp. SK2 TaxID=3015992 RepID=UPI002443DBB7|nr:PilZ domain-containing protein [Aureimonas sp. SK2]
MVAVSQPASDDNERRVAPRTRTLKRAKILFNNRFSTFDCTVRNISATGALLMMDQAVPLPKVFEIRIGDDEAVHRAKLVYRRDSFVGIHFLDGVEEVGEAGSGQDAPVMPSESLRIHQRPLPPVLAAQLPWTRR